MQAITNNMIPKPNLGLLSSRDPEIIKINMDKHNILCYNDKKITHGHGE